MFSLYDDLSRRILPKRLKRRNVPVGFFAATIDGKKSGGLLACKDERRKDGE